MIQVCSACGTRWNVREKQRVWCPRCHGTLMAPSAGAPVGPDPGWGRPGNPSSPGPTAPRPPGQPPTALRLPAGYRWIAVRPGSAPVARRSRRPLGPTPRYEVVPRWGLRDEIGPLVGGVGGVGGAGPTAGSRSGPSIGAVRATLYAAAGVLGFAAAAHLLRYVLLIVNRTMLLHPVVAGVAVWLGVLASAAAIVAVIVAAVAMTRWLIARRAAVFAHHRLIEPRPAWALWAGCLTPIINLVWAPVYVIELATAESVYPRLRKPILVWWALWVLSTAVSVFALATSFATDAQGIADNTVSMTVAYLLAVAAVLATARVYFGFERKPVERPAHRWVVVAADQRGTPESDGAVEPEGQEPAA